MSLRLYHNPRCSKSRALLGLLEERGEVFEVTLYLDSPPGREELTTLLEQLPNPPSDLVRQDARFRELGLDGERYGPGTSGEAVVALLLEHPELMQRPVLVHGSRAAIGRPPEQALEIL